MNTYQTSAQFKKSHKGAIAKDVTVAPPQVGEAENTIRFVVSSANPDRDGDSINQEGIDQTNYWRNPVLLWGHDTSAPPVGKCLSLDIIDGNLTATFQMAPFDIPDGVGAKSEMIYRMCKAGFLFATSISFLPTDWERSDRDDGGYIFNQCQLMEISVVSLPANPEAIIINDVPESGAKQIDNINTSTSDANKRRKQIFQVVQRKLI